MPVLDLTGLPAALPPEREALWREGLENSRGEGCGCGDGHCHDDKKEP